MPTTSVHAVANPLTLFGSLCCSPSVCASFDLSGSIRVGTPAASCPIPLKIIKSNQINSRRVFSWSLVSIRWLGRKQAQRKNESTLRVCRRRRRRRRRCRRHGNGQHGRSRAKKKATTAMPFNHHDAFMNRIGCSFFFLFFFGIDTGCTASLSRRLCK